MKSQDNEYDKLIEALKINDIKANKLMRRSLKKVDVVGLYVYWPPLRWYDGVKQIETIISDDSYSVEWFSQEMYFVIKKKELSLVNGITEIRNDEYDTDWKNS